MASRNNRSQADPATGRLGYVEAWPMADGCGIPAVEGSATYAVTDTVAYRLG